MFVLAPLAFGISLLLLSERRLKQGVIDDWWSDLELAPVRRLVSGRAWTLAIWVILAANLVALLLQIMPGHYHSSFMSCYVLLIPLHFMARLRQLMKPYVPKQDGPLRDWKGFKAMQSDHWGHSGEV